MKKKSSTIQNPIQSDPRIDALIRGYVSLCDQVQVLTKRLEEQEEEKVRDALTVDSILDELELAKKQPLLPSAAALQGRAPPESEIKSEPEPEPAGKTEEPQHLAQKKSRRKSKGLKIAGSVAFYSTLVLLVIASLFIRTTGSGAPRSLAGFTGMVVLTESMQSEIPKGSLVIIKQVNPNTLQIGNDITYLANQTTTVTHRIVGIIEQYEDTGQRAFQTQGVMNAQPDKLPVPAANVVGKVIFHSELLGQAASFIGAYWPFLLFVLVVAIGLTFILKRIYKDAK
mgnify:CR=1 FL=1